uniref:LisH domain-containing protein n=1 Tax=Strongyloides papillosus TaxID=174720 RepID=A0A0N5C850_STREA
MNSVGRVLYKILGKLELNQDDDEEIVTYYIIQWNNEHGPISVQTCKSIIDSSDEIAKFEARSVIDRYRNNSKSSSDFISSDEASKIIDILKQYDNRKVDFASSSNELRKSSSKSNNTPMDMVKGSSVRTRSSTRLSNSKRYNCNEATSGSRVNKHGSNNNDMELMEKAKKRTSITVDSDKKKRESVKALNISHNNILSQESVGLTSKYGKSVDKNRDSNSLDPSVVTDGYKNWENKWMNLINKDETKSRGKHNWETLELISDYTSESVHYFIGYDTETNLMSLIKDQDVPVSQKNKIDTLREFQGK